MKGARGALWQLYTQANIKLQCRHLIVISIKQFKNSEAVCSDNFLNRISRLMIGTDCNDRNKLAFNGLPMRFQVKPAECFYYFRHSQPFFFRMNQVLRTSTIRQHKSCSSPRNILQFQICTLETGGKTVLHVHDYVVFFKSNKKPKLYSKKLKFNLKRLKFYFTKLNFNVNVPLLSYKWYFSFLI